MELSLLLTATIIADHKHEQTPAFHSFRQQLFYALISTILTPLHPFMMKPEVTMCPDGHFQRVIYTLDRYIADYPEQVLTGGKGTCTQRIHGDYIVIF